MGGYGQMTAGYPLGYMEFSTWTVTVDVTTEFMRTVLRVASAFPPRAEPIPKTGPAWQSTFDDIVLARCAARSVTLVRRDHQAVRFAAPTQSRLAPFVNELRRRELRIQWVSTTLQDCLFPGRLRSALRANGI